MEGDPPLKTVFTYQELLRIALGAPVLNTVNLRVLQILIECLLRRMSCGDDLVHIEGIASTCLKSLLPQCKMSVIPYQHTTKTRNCFSDRWTQLEKLEHEMQAIEENWKRHTDCIHWYTKQLHVPLHINWLEYVGQKEDLFQRFTDDERFRALYLNRHFTTQLHNYAAEPMLDYVNDWVKDLEQIEARVKEVEEKMASACSMKLIMGVMAKIERMRQQIEENHSVYEEAVREIQAMLECKLERADFSAMKQYMSNKLTLLKAGFKKLTQEKKDCDSGRPFVQPGGFKCLSCNRPKLNPRPLPPTIFIGHSILGDDDTMPCQCDMPRKETLNERIRKMQLNVLKVTKSPQHHNRLVLSALSKSHLTKWNRAHQPVVSDHSTQNIDSMVGLQLIDGLHKLDGYISLRVDKDYVHRVKARAAPRSQHLSHHITSQQR